MNTKVKDLRLSREVKFYIKFLTGVLIRTKILGLSDRRPSRGQNFLVRPTESRAELVRLSDVLGSDFGSAPEHFFGQFRTVRQPNSRESEDKNHTLSIVFDKNLSQ
jgi:hypothetical protein